MSRPDWPVVRSAILAAVLAVHGLAAAPLPHVVTAAQLKTPVAADEVARWAERLTALGWRTGPSELGQRVIAITGAIGGAHRALLTPFVPIFRFTGTGQGWGLFANPDTHPTRLVIRAHGPDGWRIVYRNIDPEHAWGDDVLTYRRVRALYEAGLRNKPTALFQRFSKWFAARIFASDPAIDQVELHLDRTHTTLPGQPPDDRVQELDFVTVPRPR